MGDPILRDPGFLFGLTLKTALIMGTVTAMWMIHP